MASDTVTVPREVLEQIEFASNGYCPACDGWMVDKWRGATPGKHTPTCELAKSLSATSTELATSPSSDPEGGARGDQGSIATKQATSGADRSESETALRALEAARGAIAKAPEETWGMVEAEDDYGGLIRWPIQRELLASLDKAITQLTKTPSADHDDGNLRGLAAPNHQPHALSQGWQDIETAPKYDAVLLFAPGRNISDDPDEPPVFKVSRAVDYCWATHWMPLPAPPSPAKTGGAEG